MIITVNIKYIFYSVFMKEAIAFFRKDGQNIVGIDILPLPSSRDVETLKTALHNFEVPFLF